MHYVLVYEIGEDYMEKRTPHRAEHVGLAKQAYERGELVLAGALAEPVDGVMLVFREERSVRQKRGGEGVASAEVDDGDRGRGIGVTEGCEGGLRPAARGAAGLEGVRGRSGDRRRLCPGRRRNRRGAG
jgi:uncharacterized protein YciI